MEQTENTQEKPLSKQQVISNLSNMIDVWKKRAELQKLQTSVAADRALELESFAKIAYLSEQMEKKDQVEHVVTEEDIKNNPEMTEQGIKVGDTITFSKNDIVEQSDTKKNDAGLKAV